MIEVVYTETIKNISRDEAMTHRQRRQRETPRRQERQLARGDDAAERRQQSQVRRMVADFEKALPKYSRTECAQSRPGQLRGEPDSDFVALGRTISRWTGRGQISGAGAASAPDRNIQD